MDHYGTGTTTAQVEASQRQGGNTARQSRRTFRSSHSPLALALLPLLLLALLTRFVGPHIFMVAHDTIHKSLNVLVEVAHKNTRSQSRTDCICIATTRDSAKAPATRLTVVGSHKTRWSQSASAACSLSFSPISASPSGGSERRLAAC